MKSFWHKAADIDNRYMYAVVFIFAAVLVLRPLGLPVPIGSHIQDWYDYVEALPEGSVIWMDTPQSPAAWAEMGPMVRATLIHLFRGDVRVVMGSMRQMGDRLSSGVLEEVLELFPDVEYGVDVVHLGWRPGGSDVMLRAATRDIMQAYDGVDFYGNRLEDLPLMQDVPRLHPDYFVCAVVTTSGTPGAEQFLQYVIEPTGLPMIVGQNAVGVPRAMAFLDAGQFRAIIPGSTGCAQYELLLDEPGMALAAQDVLSVGMLYVTLMIILGNIAWFATRNQ